MPWHAAAIASTVLLHVWVCVGVGAPGRAARLAGRGLGLGARLLRNSLARYLLVLCGIRAAVCSSACEAGGCPVTVSS
jgi:hypothetical protein